MRSVNDQPVLERLVRLPQFAGSHLLKTGPDLRLAGPQVPVDRQHAVVQDAHLGGQPRGDMHPVGDVADRDFLFAPPRPQAGPHAAADDSVEAGDRVGVAAEPEGEDRHAKRLVRILRIDASQADQRLVRQAQLVGQRSHVLFHHVRIEPVMSGGDRRVRREDPHRGRLAKRFVEAEAVFLHPLADEFQRSKGGMSFVHVDHARLDGQRLQGAGAADAEDDFLTDPRPLVAAVQPGRQMAVFVLVLGNVGVEQKEGNAAHVDPPDAREDLPAARRDRNDDGLSVRTKGRLNRQLGRLDLGVRFLLPALLVDALRKIALDVQQADADEGDAQVGRAFQVVAGQHAQAAGIDRQRLVDAEFGREVGGRPLAENSGVRRAPGLRRLHVLDPAAIRAVDAGVQDLFAAALFELVGGVFLQERNGVMRKLRPADRIDFAKDRRDLGLPAPPIIAGQLREFFLYALMGLRHSAPTPFDRRRIPKSTRPGDLATDVMPPHEFAFKSTSQYSGQSAICRVCVRHAHNSRIASATANSRSGSRRRRAAAWSGS